MYIEVNESDLDTILSKLKMIFGIHSIVICHKVNTNKEIASELCRAGCYFFLC